MRSIANIKRARTLLAMAVYESCSNNRDTQMIEEILKEIDKVVEWQYKS